MTSSNSMSSGCCSLDEDSEDFTFFAEREKESKSFFRPTEVRWRPKIVMNEREEEKTKCLSDEELKAKIEEYNSKVPDKGMILALMADGTYTGFIRIHLRVRRPVTVSAPAFAGGDTGGALSYLPRNVVKKIHISSITTAGEVIQGILWKFTVLDNPQEFALYRQTHKDGQDILQKLPITEHPLYLRLVAGPEETIVLKENKTGEVDGDTMAAGGSERGMEGWRVGMLGTLRTLTSRKQEKSKQLKENDEDYKDTVRKQEKSKQEERNEDLKATVSELERRIRQLEENDKDQEEKITQLKRSDKHQEERIRKQEEKSRELEEKSRQLEENDKDFKATVSELKKRFEELGNKSGARPSGQHFIVRHRTALIKRVSMVDAVLDLLLEWEVLTDEMCANVRSHNTSQKQMQELLNLGSIRGSQNGKERLYEALKKEEPAIIKELENMQASR